MSRYWEAGGRDFKGYRLVSTRFSEAGAWTEAQRQELNSIMDSAVGAMRSSIQNLESNIVREARNELLLTLAGGAGLFAKMFTSTDDARLAALSGLKTIKNIVDRLDGPSRQEVLAGTMAPEKWLGSSKVVLEGVKDQADILKDSSLASFAMGQYEATVQAFKDFMARAGKKFEEVFDIAKYVVPITIGVGVLAALFILPKVFRLTPAGRVLGGYKRRKKRLGWWEPEMQLEGYSRRR